MKIYNTKKTVGKFTLNIKNLKLESNKINIILGENGSGKSTLCKCLAMKEIKCDIENITILNQRLYVYNQKVFEIVKRVIKWNETDITVDEFLHKYNLKDKKEVGVKSLSGGEFRRLSLGLILCTKSELLILDEPFVGIDVNSQKNIIDILKYEKEKRTIILVSHKLNICNKLGQHFIFMKDGNIIYSGDKDGFINNKENTIKNFLKLQRGEF